MEIPELLLKLFPIEAILWTLGAGLAASGLTELIKPFIKKWQPVPENADLWILGIVWLLTELGVEAIYISKQWGQITVEGVILYLVAGIFATLLAVGGWNYVKNIIDKITPKKSNPGT